MVLTQNSGTLNVTQTVKEQVCITLCGRTVMNINLFQCNNVDTNVHLHLLPDQKWKNRMCTQVKRKTVEPVFEEKFEFLVPLEKAKTRKLDVSSKNMRMLNTGNGKTFVLILYT
ncbi:extended synaptotagmin-3-like [Colossoma macropomum]|uniref:extended synaptotagmin-3-like n=1 Tax=Colossoma macropomum TaxID=42526 RepID=UPI0018648B16|nr:extended synaptotagmin-3-like [Colossoma macropomum]